RYVDNMFRMDYLMTIGTDIRTKTININGDLVKLIIWDLGGQPLFQDVRATYCKGANGAVLAFDLTRQHTLNNLQAWAETVWRFVGKVPLAVVGTKADLKSIRETSIERALDFARFTGAKVFETSSKTGEGVEKTFIYLAETILNDLK
nr:GTP-binding protein [Candidatus Dadabacteria bacterium]NIQ13320.1 GTP-binding protein [Candidatus Dadabacteria bacterium]